jgi:hypothetical protein
VSSSSTIRSRPSALLTRYDDELQVVLEGLLRRLPTLELAVPSAELPLVEGLLVGGLREVRVIWR